jgi:glucose dehydrogenase
MHKRHFFIIAVGCLLLAGVALVGAQQRAKQRRFNTWRQYLGGADSSQYSSLNQINKSNVAKLEVAWTYPTGDMRTYRFNPVVVDGVMYVLAKNLSIVALDAATGKEIWTHANEGAVGDRGINYWESADRSDRRLVYMNGGFLTAIDARTGQTIESFGEKGRVDVRLGLHRDVTNIRPLQTGNPGRIFENLIIISLPAGGAAYVSNPGDTHAYDVRTGKLVWVFHTVPEKGEFGADTWPEAALENGGGVHNWSELSVDESRGIVYIPLGTARFDFYGGNRHGDNLFGNSVLALDARTGTRLWHFQTVHHDLWDYDLPSPPGLLDVTINGEVVPILAQTSKTGYMYILNRVTGKPIFGMEERKVTKSDVPNEESSPTQPVPVKPPPLARVAFKAEEIVSAADTTAEHAAFCRALMERSGGFYNVGPFTPYLYHDAGALPRSTILFPGSIGGANWGGTASDPSLGYVFVNTNDEASIGWVEKSPDGARVPFRRNSIVGLTSRFQWAEGDARTGNGNIMGGEHGWLCQRPPWGNLVAVNVRTGDIAWKVPLGITDELPTGKRNTGRLNLGGPITTAGGLVFIGATNDKRFRAFDEKTGNELWVTRLDMSAHAVPITYQGRDGKQYVAITASGASALDDPAPAGAEALVVFALP